MKKTLLLVFVHGFKGGDDTFGTFPEHLRALVSHAHPKIDVVAITYPKFDTRGNLKECVGRFREWLQNKVIDIEVAHQTPSPTIDPSVHVILIGHSMGGIVAADTLLLIASETPIPHPSTSRTANSTTEPNPSTSTSPPQPDEGTETAHQQPPPSPPYTFIFPYILGLLAFDTPFLGIAPGVVAHGAEGHLKTASSAYSSLSEVAGVFGWGSKSEPNLNSTTNTPKVAGYLPSSDTSSAAVDAAATPPWQRWGRYAMFAGAAGAVAAAGGAALYTQRDKFSLGWNWVTSHLEFVGCLARGEELKQRVKALSLLDSERGIGSADFYTNLGKGADEGTGVSDEVLASKDRTFCSLPRDLNVNVDVGDGDGAKKEGLHWVKAVNDKARDETGAHMSMFYPRDNPGFYALGKMAKEVVGSWVQRGWYDSSTDDDEGEGRTGQVGGVQAESDNGKEWEKVAEEVEEPVKVEKEEGEGEEEGKTAERSRFGPAVWSDGKEIHVADEEDDVVMVH